MSWFNQNSILSKKELQLGHIHALIEKGMESGLFYRFAPKKRNYLLTKFRKLRRQVGHLRFQLNMAAVAGTILAAGTSADIQAQSNIGPFQVQTRAFNPLRHPLWGEILKPTIVDLDKDGDYDVVVGQIYGNFRVFLNEGGATNPKFTDHNLLDESLNPIFSSGAPAFADLNGDGLDDLIIGFDGSGDRILYFVNNGGIPGDPTNPLTFTEQFGPWDPVLKTGNPFDTILPGDNPVLHFVNFDADSDMDVIIGHYYSNVGDGINVHYYENDGSGVFTPGTFTTMPDIDGSSNYDAAPFLADLDEDGDNDLIIGRVGGDFRFFEKTALGFEENADPWDPMTKTGNPLYGIDLGYYSAAVFADFDNDGDLDMVAGSLGPNSPYDPLHFFLNQGNGVFVEQKGFNNPFDGVDIGDEAAPYFVDLDGDNDLDVIVGRDDSSDNLSVFINNNGLFLEDPTHPIAQIDLTVNNIKPMAIDMDNDGDIDLFVALDDQVIFYRNNNGSFDIEPNTIDVTGLTPGTEFSLALLDINMDGNLDAILGNDGFSPAPSLIQYMENKGTNAVPNFVAAPSPSPFDAQTLVHTPNVFSADIDHDGDTDLLIAESIYHAVLLPYVTTFRLFINNGDQTFSESSLPISLPQTAPNQSYISMADIDGDGDLDIFIGLGDDLYGDEGGTIKYIENQNPAPITTVNSAIFNFSFGGGSEVIDASITIADADSDLITRATVSIKDYQADDEVLDFEPQSPITGGFDAVTGVLTLQGTAPVATYQGVLRSVTYVYTGADPGGRRGSLGRTKAVSRTVDFSVFDSDFTTPLVASRTINVSTLANQPPSISLSTLDIVIRGSASIDLAPLVTDGESNFDPNAPGAFGILQQPQSGAVASFAGSILTIDYANLNFTGTETMEIEVCDTAGACTLATLSIVVIGEVVVRNGFSPNGDSYNPYFQIDDIEIIEPQNNVTIFNRWGDKVFEVDNYANNDPAKRFNGISDAGKDLPSGVYFYKIKFGSGSPELRGYLTLKR